MKKFYSALLPVIFGTIFFIIGFLTLSDYNIMWDGRGHFLRGQSYVNFFLTGKEDYDKAVSKEYVRYYRDYIGRSNPGYENSFYVPGDSYRKSIYKDPFNGYRKYKYNPGHPPLSDIGAAFFNIIFYEKLGLVGDDSAYGLFALFLSSSLVALIFAWMRRSYGSFAAIVAVIALSTYPLFWAEAHFNIKDVPSMVFFSFSIFAFWKGVSTQSLKWILASSVFTGFALATRFNALFLLFIFFLWFVIFYLKQQKTYRQKYHKFWWLLFVYPLVMFGILFVSHPYLWQDPIRNFLDTFSYYKGIGFDIDYTPQFRTFFGFNTYAGIWIAITTYPLVLILSLLGVMIGFIKFFKSKDTLILLFLLWFLVPVLRVSLPKSAIYDGVRQIMEFIPAMAILAGIGASYMVKWINGYVTRSTGKQFSYFAIQLLVVFLFIPLFITLVKFHPAENVYFNSFIGGLMGAKERNITSWGNTDGGIYKIAVNWLNENGEKNSHIATGFSEPADFYLPGLRGDLYADNRFSGYLREGEYIVALTHDTGLDKTYRMAYPEKFLDPVYVYRIDGVPLIKIWKNDKKYLKEEFKNLLQKQLTVMSQRVGNVLRWELVDNVRIEIMEFSFENNSECSKLTNGYFQVSQDNEDWEILPDTYPGAIIEALGEQPNEDKLIAPFVGARAKYIEFVVDPENSCVFKANEAKITYEL
ncbi:MAG: glycosyltransferase family 39 protein [Candidatus Levybacteria bacterium]|nr:glycosyltransferase family 39 protein [Candidatus Levybacteria bacterium]